MWYNNHLRFNNQLTSTSAVNKMKAVLLILFNTTDLKQSENQNFKNNIFIWLNQ